MGQKNKQSNFPSLASPFFLSFVRSCADLFSSTTSSLLWNLFFLFWLQILLRFRCFGFALFLGFLHILVCRCSWFARFCVAGYIVKVVVCFLSAGTSLNKVLAPCSWWCGAATEFWTVGSPQIPAVWIIKELGSLTGVCMEAKTTLLRFINST